MERELRIDWIACEAFGVCHDLAPDLVALDDWGYPIMPSTSAVESRPGDVRRIVDCCPARALRLVQRHPARSGRKAGPSGRRVAGEHRSNRAAT